MTTHELGHNFGAEHDPDDMPDCAPREDQGGKYVMYPIAVSGDHTNNKVVPRGDEGCSVQPIKSDLCSPYVPAVPSSSQTAANVPL